MVIPEYAWRQVHWHEMKDTVMADQVTIVNDVFCIWWTRPCTAPFIFFLGPFLCFISHELGFFLDELIVVSFLFPPLYLFPFYFFANFLSLITLLDTLSLHAFPSVLNFPVALTPLPTHYSPSPWRSWTDDHGHLQQAKRACSQAETAAKTVPRAHRSCYPQGHDPKVVMDTWWRCDGVISEKYL